MKKIQQHYYTNSQRGLYNKARGYDTIAKSKGLDESFIKNVLHRICIYKPPTGLQDDDSEDLSKYPEALTCIQPEEDILVIGKAVYKPFNFSNDRNTYFVHNLIIEDDYKDELIEKIYKLLRINSFSRESDGNTELPELTELQFDSELEPRLTKDELFKELKINDDIFKTLVYCSIMSISDNKVLYIDPDVEISQLNSYSKLLLEYLLMCLPFEIRRKIGFITYASEVGMKYVNIMFIDKFNKTIDKSELKYGYLFDLYNKSIPKLDNNLKNQSYLNFVINNLEDIKKIQDFNSFADGVLKNTEDSIKASVEIYNKICELYMYIVNEDTESYLENEDKILKLIEDLVNIKGIDKKAINPSYDELLKVKEENFDYENDTEAIVNFVRKLKTYYEIGDKFAQKTIDFILEVIKKSMNNVRNRIFDVIEDNSKIITALFNRLYENEEYGKAILFNRLEEELSTINNMSGIAKFIESKSEINSKLIEDDEVIIKVKDRLEEIINRLRNKNEIISWFSLFTSSIEKKSEKIKEIFRTYNKELLDTLLKDYTIESISIDEIDKLEKIDLSIYKNTDSEEIIKKFKCLRDVLKVMQPVDRKIIEELSSLDAGCREQISKRIKTEFKSSAKEENYSRLMLAFKKFTSAEENSAYNDFNFKELLKFIFEEKGEEEVVKFLCWTAKEESLFGRAVEEADCYFNGEEASLFENKQYREKLLNKKNSFMRGKLYPIYVSYKKKDDAYIDQERKHNKKKMFFILVPIGIMIIIAIPITVKHFWPKNSGKVITQINTPQIETTPKATSSPSVQNNANNTEAPKVDTDSIKQEEIKRVREVLKDKQDEITTEIDNMVDEELKKIDAKTKDYGYLCKVTCDYDGTNGKSWVFQSIKHEWKDDYFGIPEKNIVYIYSSKSNIEYFITFNGWIDNNSDEHLPEKINAINRAVIEVVTKYMNNAFN